MLDYNCLKQLTKFLGVDITSQKEINLSFYSTDYKTKNCDLLNEFMIKETKEKVLVIDATNYIYLWSDNLKTFKNIFYNILKKIQIYCSQKSLRGIIFLMDQRIMKVKHYDDYEYNNIDVNVTPNISNFNNNNSISEDENNYARFDYCNNQYKKLLGSEEISDYYKGRLKEIGREFDELMSTKLPLNYVDQLKNKDFKFFVIDTIIELLYKNINFVEYCQGLNDDKFLVLSSYSKYYFIDKSSYDKSIKRCKENKEIEKILKLQYYEADQIIPYVCDLLKKKFDIFICGNDGDLLLGLLDNCSKRIKTKNIKDKKFINIDDIIFENRIIILKDIWKNTSKITKSISYYDINDLYKNLNKSVQIIGRSNNIKLKYNIDTIFYITTICRLCKNDYINKKNIPELGPAILIKTFFNHESFLQFQDNFFKIIKINNKLIISIDYAKFVSYIIHCYLNSSRVITDNYLKNNFNTRDTVEDIFQKINNSYKNKLLDKCERNKIKKLKFVKGKNEAEMEIGRSYKYNIKEIEESNYININNINNVYTTLIFSINYFSQFYDDISKIDDGCKVSNDPNKSIYGYSLIDNYKNEYGLYKVNLCKNIDINLYC